jgi:hypothetical protein
MLKIAVPFRIVLENPPAGVDFALQKGKGNVYEVVQKQRSAGKNLVFEFSADVQAERMKEPTFSGAVLQGPPRERFVYIDIGTYAGQHDSPWSRRLKVPLRDITWQSIDWLAANPKSVLETCVAGTAKDGGPACAAVKPFAGWRLLSNG